MAEEPVRRLHRVRVVFDEGDGVTTEVEVEYGDHYDHDPVRAWKTIGELAELRRQWTKDKRSNG